MDAKETKKIEVSEAKVGFLIGMLEKTSSFIQHLDSQIDILLGLSSAVFLLSSSSILNDTHSVWYVVLSIFSALSTIIALYAIHPPRFMRKRGQFESILYNKNISNLKVEEYCEKVKAVCNDEDAIIKECATEIYNIATYYYRPKRKLYHYSRDTFLAGIILGLIFYLAVNL